jgi:hypothetical protein
MNLTIGDFNLLFVFLNKIPYYCNMKKFFMFIVFIGREKMNDMIHCGTPFF